MEIDQALDFTSSSKKKFNEAPVLDLSFKKSPENHGISYSLSPSPSENRSLSPSSDSNAEHHHHNNNNNNHHRHEDRHNSSGFINEDEKHSYEERSYIETPPPDHDSPRKLKYDYSELSGEEMMHRYAMSQMNIPVQVASIIPTSLAAQNGGVVRQMQVPVSAAAATAASSSSSSSSATASHNEFSMEQGRKAPRPFKAYPKDPLSLSMGPELMYDPKSNEQYTEFRKRMLESVRRTNEGTNIKMRRTSKSPVLPTSTMDDKDAAYWERRRKNNEAAKRSRDARRAKEDEIAIRAAFLEQENLKLKYELVTLRQEHAKLRCLIYSN